MESSPRLLARTNLPSGESRSAVAEKKTDERHHIDEKDGAEHGRGAAFDQYTLSRPGVDMVLRKRFDLALQHAAFTAAAVAAAGGHTRDGDLGHVVREQFDDDAFLCHVQSFLISMETL